jgi:hypothetical protein
MADKPIPEADALEQARAADEVDLDLVDAEDDPEIGSEVPEADALEQSRPRAVPAAVRSRPIPADAPENDVLDQRRDAGDEDDGYDDVR